MQIELINEHYLIIFNTIPQEKMLTPTFKYYFDSE